MANGVLSSVAAAERARRPGCLVRSIAWGPWAGGMVTPGLARIFEKAGVQLIALDSGAEALAREVASDDGCSEVVVMNGVAPLTARPIHGGRSFDGRVGAEDGFEVLVNAATYPQLDGHRIVGAPVVPAVLVIEWFFRAAAACFPSLTVRSCRNLRVLRGIPVEAFEQRGVRLFVRARVVESTETGAKLELKLFDDREKPRYAGVVEMGVSPATAPPNPLTDAPDSGEGSTWSIAQLYSELLFHRGPFAVIRSLDCVFDQSASAELAGLTAAGWPGASWCSDPALIDGGLQLGCVWGRHVLGGAPLPTSIGSFELYRTGPIDLARALRPARPPRRAAQGAPRSRVSERHGGPGRRPSRCRDASAPRRRRQRRHPRSRSVSERSRIGPAMEKRHGAGSESEKGTKPERMPRPPARLGATAAMSPSEAPTEAPSGHPVFAHHERVTAAHAEFLRFSGACASRVSRSPQASPRIPRATGDGRPRCRAARRCPPNERSPRRHRREAPVATTSEVAQLSTRETRALAVGWDDWLLDSHVLPLGAVFSALAGVAQQAPDGTDAPFGVLSCELLSLGRLAGPGDTIVTTLDRVDRAEAATGRSETTFRFEARVRDGGRPLVGMRGTRSRSAPSGAPARRGPAPGAIASSHSPRTWATKRQFSERELSSLYAGEAFACFGAGFERAAPHTRTPPLPGARLVRLTAVSSLEPAGGPWALGSLRAQAFPGVGDASAKDDPGLRLGRVFQGAQQVLAFFAMASGATIARDGWRFECAEGQSGELSFFDAPAMDAPLEYELVVERLDGGPWSGIVGDVTAWSGDRLVFRGERLALRLVPDFPLTSNRSLQADGLADQRSGRPAANIDGFRLDYASMVAGAVGRPTDAFNQAGAFFETGERQMPRLPGPPYHFVTRVTHVAGERLSMRPGAEATMEYDVPADAWYFDENGNRSMPWCVLLEAALQPCGWLSVYVGCPIVASEDVFFRNLDGAGKMTGEVFAGSTVRTHTKVTSVSSVAGIILVSYKIECHVGDRQVCHLTAAFGYFSNAALDAQVGLKTTPEQRTRLTQESPVEFDLTERPEKYCAGPLRLPGPMLLMIDRVSGFWHGEGAAGKARLRVEKTVRPNDWYFRSHFYSDPVQPGTLGIEQMLQTIQFYIIEENLYDGIEQPYFEPLVLDSHVSWKYRGQVRPENKRIVSEIEIVSVESSESAVTVLANGSLWVDGARCYEAKGIGVRVKGHRDVLALPARTVESVVDPAVDAWVSDHRPSYTVPVMPMMSMVDRLAAAALAHVREAYPQQEGTPEWVVTGGTELRAHGWLICDRPKRLRTEVRVASSRAVHRTEETEVLAALYELSDGAPKRVASGRIRLARSFPKPPPAWGPLEDGVPTASPYESGSIYWGPKLQVLRRLALSGRGASADLDAAGAEAPIGAIHHILLDGSLHGIPHDELERWSDKIPPGLMGAPVRLTAQFFGPPPTQGIVRAEVRFAGFDGANAFPTYLIQMIDPQGQVWATLRHVEMLLPFGHRTLTKKDRIPFLVQRRYQKGTGLSEFHPDRTTLRAADVKRMDGLPGSVAHVYGLPRDAVIDARVIAIKDHVGQRAQVHPGAVQVDLERSEAWSDADPSKRYKVSVEQEGSDVTVRD